jgi:hypothetical protein
MVVPSDDALSRYLPPSSSAPAGGGFGGAASGASGAASSRPVSGALRPPTPPAPGGAAPAAAAAAAAPDSSSDAESAWASTAAGRRGKQAYDLVRQRRQDEVDGAKGSVRASDVASLDARTQQYDGVLRQRCYFAVGP